MTEEEEGEEVQGEKLSLQDYSEEEREELLELMTEDRDELLKRVKQGQISLENYRRMKNLLKHQNSVEDLRDRVDSLSESQVGRFGTGVNTAPSMDFQRQFVRQIDRLEERHDKTKSRIENIDDELHDLRKDVSEIIEILNDTIEAREESQGEIAEKFDELNSTLEEIKARTGIHFEDISTNLTTNMQLMGGLFFLVLALAHVFSPGQPLMTKLSAAAATGLLVPIVFEFAS